MTKEKCDEYHEKQTEWIEGVLKRQRKIIWGIGWKICGIILTVVLTVSGTGWGYAYHVDMKTVKNDRELRKELGTSQRLHAEEHAGMSADIKRLERLASSYESIEDSLDEVLKVKTNQETIINQVEMLYNHLLDKGDSKK